MSAQLITLVEARTAQLELRKRLVRNLDDLEAAVADDGERDALLIAGAGVAVPEDSALLSALEAFEESTDFAAIAKYLKDTRVIVLNVDLGKFGLKIGQLKAELAKAPSVLFVTAPRKRMANLHLMYGSFARAMTTPLGAAVAAVRGDAASVAVEPAPRAAVGVKENRPATAVSASSPADAARTRRNELLDSERWLNSQAVAERARGAAVESNPYEYASRLRREKRLFGARFRGSYHYPEFQFVPETGEPHAAMAQLVPLLPGSHDGWTAALWLFEPTGRLGDARPADVFRSDPAAVIDAARRDFKGDDGDW